MQQPNLPKLDELESVPEKSRRILPVIVGCALLMQMLDATVVTTALPTMARELGSNPIEMNLAITSYLISTAVFVPISGWAADRYGARKVFIAAIVLFSLSSLTCALSQTLTQLVISRIVQGLGGAMMVPVGRIILLRTIPKQELIKAMALLSMPALIGPMAGPPLGGFLVTYASWHWIFLINIPIGFFENNIKIRYGYDDYKEGWTNINPKTINYYAYDTTGTDYKFTLNDLPLIWKDKISVIDSNIKTDGDEMIQHRLKSIFDMVVTSPYFEVDEEVINKIFDKYLENFNYKIDA